MACALTSISSTGSDKRHLTSMDGITVLKPMLDATTMAHGSFLDDEMDTSAAILFSSHHHHVCANVDESPSSPNDSTAAWDDSKLCISIDHESTPDSTSCEAIYDLPSACLTADRKRKDIDTAKNACAINSPDNAPTEKKPRIHATDAAAPTSVQFTAVHNETTRFVFTAFGSTSQTLGVSFPLASSTPFSMSTSTFVSSTSSSSRHGTSSPPTPRIRSCLD
ncbi:hypothetical protein LEN26_012748 [Aphanomyces euteiches]|nr:hypothetical protein AeMF1_012685 [Aphanomyces euteiches]KAH9117243.1 hypothetical protein LEN26_012748 [Aphanomyces euteiches]KAH9191061.1 hypothetical protein AeNC1_006965 [Aphanomyces euteiches]